MKDKLEAHYEDFKSVFDVLPTNNKANREKKTTYLDDEIKKNEKELKIVEEEIAARIKVLEELVPDKNVQILQEKLSTCDVTNEWNKYNTSYEKMHLDFYLYQLQKYYKEDLTSVNECLKRIVASFEKVGIILTPEDFDFNKYAAEYMTLIIKKSHEEELKNKFEEIYWHFPELIKTIEVNFKSIYQRYEKKIDKYYAARNEEFLKTHNNQEIYDMRIKLNKQLKNVKHRDGALIFEKFKNGEYSLATYKEKTIETKINTYFNEGSYNYDNLTKLANTLFEYSLIIKYNYLLNNMKERLEKKEEYKSVKASALKGIADAEKKLKALNKKNEPKFKFMKAKQDEKWLFKYKEVLTDIIAKYDAFDNDCFNDLVYSKLSQDSTVLEVFQLITSCYIYFVTETKKNEEGKNISDITKEFNALKDDINNKQYTLLNSLALLDRKKMKQVIVDKYKLEGINLTIESLEDENLEHTMGDIEDLITYEDINGSNADLADIELYLEYEKINKGK